MNKRQLFEKNILGGANIEEFTRRKNPIQVNANEEFQIEHGFSIYDVKQGLRIAQDLQHIPFVEADAKSGKKGPALEQQELLKKYTELSLLSQFLRSYDMSVFEKLDQAQQLIDQAGASNPKIAEEIKAKKVAEEAFRNMAINIEKVAAPI